MHAKHPLIDNSHQAISNGRWHARWFLKVEKICPFKDDHLNLPLKSVANKKL
jgi:hypothetical protein